MASSPLALAQVLSAKQSNSGTVEEAKGRLHPVNLGVISNVSFACKTCNFEYFLSDKANFGIQTVTGCEVYSLTDGSRANEVRIFKICNVFIGRNA